MQEIKDWLAAEEKDFATGIQLFQKYSRNRAMILYLARKQDMNKLVYELEKLSKFENLKPVVQVKNTTVLVNRALHIVPAKEEGAETSASTNDPEVKLANIQRAYLPADLQIVYDNIVDAYKTQRVIHEKIKLAETDEARAELRTSLIGLDELIADGWGQIDNHKPAEDVKEPATDIVKLVNSARTYISREIKKYNPDKREKLIDRINLLIEQKASVSAKTREKLIELNVITTESNLLVE